MLNKNDKVRLQVINTYSKGFEFIKDETNSPLIIELSVHETLEDTNFPQNLLILEVYEIHEGNVSYKQLIHRIFVGEVYTLDEMSKINQSFRFSQGMDLSDLTGLNGDTPCVFYKIDENRYSLLAKLKDMDIVVTSALELKNLLDQMSNDFIKVQDGMSRIRNLK